MTSSSENDPIDAQASVTPADPTTRYRCLDYTAYYAGDDFKLFESSVTGARNVLPAISEQLLKASGRFLTLDEHAAVIQQVEPFREVPVEMLRELLTGLASSDLLIAHQDLAARCTCLVGEHRPATISVVGIPTCNRPGGLRRVASTMAENAARHGRRIEIVVADDSDEEHQAENVTVLQEICAQYGIDIWYAGPDEKSAFARELAEYCDVPLATAQAAIHRPAEWPGAPGANRNTLLLHAVGEALLTLDDDMVVKVGRLPASDDGLTLTSSSDPTHFWFYPDPEATLAATEFVEEDFVGLHEALLGCNVGRLAADWSGAGPLDLDDLSNDFLMNLAPDGGGVTFTMAGGIGDSGLKESLPFFFVRGASLARLHQAEGGHRGAMASRQLARGVLRTTVSDTDFCIGTNLGLDNRELLPPFQTAARNEDGIFAVMVRLCMPGSFIGFLPRALVHDPVVRRRFDVERFDQTVGTLEAADAILHLIGPWPTPPGRSTARRRLVSLGSFLIEVGALPPAEFTDRLRRAWLENCSAQAAYIERALKMPDAALQAEWTTDLRRYLDRLAEQIESDAPLTLGELDSQSPESARGHLQQYIRDFGMLLCAWPDLVEGSRELRNRGRRPGRRITSGVVGTGPSQ